MRLQEQVFYDAEQNSEASSIGVGGRGQWLIRRVVPAAGFALTVLCDPSPEAVENARAARAAKRDPLRKLSFLEPVVNLKADVHSEAFTDARADKTADLHLTLSLIFNDL